MENLAEAAPARTRRGLQLLTGKERRLAENEIIVSKTDIPGKITYVNDVFLRISGYTEKEVIGKPHSIIRHPHMPRAVFKLLWDTVAAGDEIFAYVMNRCKEGDHYWVLAHVTPSYALSGALIGYHSSRRAPRREALRTIEPFYRTLYDMEQQTANRKEGLIRSHAALLQALEEKKITYPEFVLSL